MRAHRTQDQSTFTAIAAARHMIHPGTTAPPQSARRPDNQGAHLAHARRAGGVRNVDYLWPSCRTAIQSAVLSGTSPKPYDHAPGFAIDLAPRSNAAMRCPCARAVGRRGGRVPHDLEWTCVRACPDSAAPC